VPVLDLFPALSDDPGYQAGLAANDGLHSDAAGYQAIADLIQTSGPWQKAHR
jgi:lysophospholipase L1-like esterase